MNRRTVRLILDALKRQQAEIGKAVQALERLLDVSEPDKRKREDLRVLWTHRKLGRAS